MAIEKIYEIICDNCGCAANHLPFKPTTKLQFKNCGIYYYKGFHLCSEDCLMEFVSKKLCK